MTLKRKRSSSELPSSPLSFASAFSSPPSDAASRIDYTPRMGLINPCHLHSRTLKRLRDNRPSQEEIHQRTLGMLYAAQQQQQYQDPPSPSPVVEVSLELEQAPQENRCTQQSLHRFWNIQSQPTAAPNTTVVLEMEMDQS
ncbi:hypothetical protein NQ176_g9767 [Zarea fungicola]|uniref:Uncharacterized protein n=1 Tax=Zarea fungicola TaxID=93591 RepID=A0ACC1MJP0_9HYPO|nr:hypothetical protein NQ176_g9767 [Lecanicillium fungicola]